MKPLKSKLYYESFDTQRWHVVKCPKAFFCLLKILLFINTHEFQWRKINAFHNELVALFRILLSAFLKSTTNFALHSEAFIASILCESQLWLIQKHVKTLAGVSSFYSKIDLLCLTKNFFSYISIVNVIIFTVEFIIH